MPVLECPKAGCNYKTDNLDDAFVAALMEAHCVNHASPETIPATNSEESTIYIKLPLKKITLADLCLNKEIRGNMIGFIFCTASLLLDVVLSFTQTNWYHTEDENDEYKSISSVGLWKACIMKELRDQPGLIESTCVHHDEERFLKEYTIVVGAQSFQCLGITLIAVAIVATFLKLCLWRSRNLLTVIGATHAFWAGVSFFGSLGSVSHGLNKTSQVSYRDIGYAFAGISGAVAIVGSFILMITASWKTQENKKPTRNVNESELYQELVL